MVYITVGIEEDCYDALRGQALADRRVIHWTAEGLLREGLHLDPIERPVVVEYVEPEDELNSTLE